MYFAFAAYVQEIFDTHTKSSKKSLKDAALKLKEMSPKPMDSMFEKLSRAEALKNDRRAMVILDVPPTTPGIYFMYFLVYSMSYRCLPIYAASWSSILFQFKMIFFLFVVGYCQTIEIK